MNLDRKGGSRATELSDFPSTLLPPLCSELGLIASFMAIFPLDMPVNLPQFNWTHERQIFEMSMGALLRYDCQEYCA